jgi:hypothetical protein
MENIKLIDVNLENILEYPIKCFINPKNPGYIKKLDWYKKNILKGLKIKLLYYEKKHIGFIEYIPGKYAWRAVSAKDYLFIHCIWISPNKFKQKGYGSLLVNECIKDAETKGKLGVSVVTSYDSFMAEKHLFLKNNFKLIQEDGKFQLLVKTLKKGKLPKINDYKNQLKEYKGLNIVYSDQCPWVARSIIDLKNTAKEYGIKLKIKKIETTVQAQNAPSIYSVFSLIYNGKLIVDHYISNTRFKNIIKQIIK